MANIQITEPNSFNTVFRCVKVYKAALSLAIEGEDCRERMLSDKELKSPVHSGVLFSPAKIYVLPPGYRRQCS